MLPNITTVEQFKAINIRDAFFAEAACRILALSKKAVTTTSFPSNGSLPVIFIDDTYVIKFFPSVFADAFQTELKALNFLNQHNVPKLMSTGKIDSWDYILMNKLSGQSLKNIWPELSLEDRLSACQQIGSQLRQIHDLQVSSDFDVSSWTYFLKNQKTACYERHQKLGLREDLLQQIPRFLDSVDLTWNRISFLHTEVMQDHVFFEMVGDKISFTGFIDFEPSMVGAPEYDFASVAVFVSSGDRSALGAFFEGYGRLELATDLQFKRRIMAYLLLHRYSNLKWYLEFMPNAASLDELVELWF